MPVKGVERTVIERLPTFDVNSTFETVRLKGILFISSHKTVKYCCIKSNDMINLAAEPKAKSSTGT